jgi:hypothetical protein
MAICAASRRSLGIDRLTGAPNDAVARIWNRCNRYFHGNRYTRWFNRLEEILNHVDASYYADTACHLDLSQWATDPTWNGLPPQARQRLVNGDAEFLQTQLRSEPIRLLLLNGRSVISAFQSILGGQLGTEPETVNDRSVTTTLFTGQYGNVYVIGWSTNLQSGFGVTNVLRQRLVARVRELHDRDTTAPSVRSSL